ncbi:hypothetical protein BDV95DRAFT_595850 [Massariosphaeria phaeospora]|uniref:BSD domain-containing protein n=1 Tax=Massariosphaeria phaeospora TaxID=100035 RepID=A0A7C8I7R8_9PLEO|nr:hypothetical protein BDV95DRAFT_595850 [Massariosphaeria phaeospora]
MDSAYDHIQEESYPQLPKPQDPSASDSSRHENSNINSEIQDAYKAISSSPWAAKLGGFFGTVKKQGEQYYDGATKQATAGISTLISHTRTLSVQTGDAAASTSTPADTDGPTDSSSPAHPERPDSLPADIFKEAEGMLSRFRSEAAKRLKDIEKAEDAADEALLKFGTNIRGFLRDAVTIAPPEGGEGADDGRVLFESKDSSGKKVVHATRFDAQLHVIHSSLESFLKDPVSPEWESWKKGFDVEQKTDAISKDLDKHEELRHAMEQCVPEKVEYAAFWCRYYFLRHVIETDEQRRREMLKASTPADEEVSWDEDSEDDESTTPNKSKSPINLAASKETLKPSDTDLKPPVQPRRSNDEKSVADSDASYDLVSGATSRAPGSPQDKKKAVAEESDEEDWE